MKSILKAVMAILVLLSINFSNAQDKKATELQGVFDNYFQLKDALVKSSSKAAASESAELLAALKAIVAGSLSPAEQTSWSKVSTELTEDAEHISNTSDIGHQRDHFITLSKNIYELLKVSKVDTPVYYQFCPMANNRKGANWLSKESTIKNPYYGAQMLTCGKTVETIK